MKWHTYLVLTAMLMVSNMALARVTYVRFLWKEGIVRSEYIFRYDEDNLPRLYDVSRRDLQEVPPVQVPVAFVTELEELMEKGDVLSYAPSYQPAEELCGGYVWELEVRMEDGRSVQSNGHSVLPPNSILDGLDLLMQTYSGDKDRKR